MSLEKPVTSKRERKKELLDLRRLIRSLHDEEMLLKKEMNECLTADKVPEDLGILAKQQIKNLKLLTAFRCAGITVIKNHSKQSVICIDTSFNGIYYGQYQFELQNDNTRWTVKDHTVPYFLPVVSILKSNQYANPKDLIDDASKYLSTYTTRFGQIQEVQKVWPSNAISITATAVMDLIRIYFAEGSQLVQGISFDLKYSLTDERPNTVTYIQEKRNGKKDLHNLDKIAEAFEKHTIKTVINQIFSADEYEFTTTKSMVGRVSD